MCMVVFGYPSAWDSFVSVTELSPDVPLLNQVWGLKEFVFWNEIFNEFVGLCGLGSDSTMQESAWKYLHGNHMSE